MSNFFSVETSLNDRMNAIQTYLHVQELEKPNLLQLKEKLDKFHRGEIKNLTTKEQGDLLEDFFEALFKSIRSLNVQRNSNTSSNEIDIIIKLNEVGKSLKAVKIIPSWFPNMVVLECKNYTSRVGVTFVNKFKSVVDLTPSKIGCFISYLGLTGQDKSGWQDAHGLVYKYGLMHLANKEKPLILNITKLEMDKLVENDFNFFDWIEDIYISIMSDMKIDFDTL